MQTPISKKQQNDLICATNQLARIESCGGTGTFRQYINRQRGHQYRDILDQVDCLAVLQAPHFDSVFKWRQLQKKKLVQRLKQEVRPMFSLLNLEQLVRFMSYFERLTKRGIITISSVTYFVITLQNNHAISGLTSNLGGSM